MSELPKSQLAGIEWPSFTASRHVHVLSLLFQLEHTEWMSPDDLRQLQMLQAQQVIDHAAETVPFYRGRLAGLAGRKPGELTYDALRCVPLLKRTDVQGSEDELHSRNVPAEHGPLITASTSGSTGRPITVRGTTLAAIFFRALGLRFHLWHKRDLSGKNVTIRAAHTMIGEEYSASWVGGYDTGPHCSHDISQSTRRLFDCLIKDDPHYLQTHPYTLRELIRHSEDTGIAPRNLKEARTFGEVLDPDVREAASRVWGIPVADNYSATEVGIISLQCPETVNHHIQSENVLVEILDDDGNPCEPGQIGRVVCTDLHNFAMPLIRYEIGDFAEVAQPCSCGRGLPTLRRVIGRLQDFMLLASGDRIRPVLDPKRLLEVAPIRQYQLTQKSYETIEVKLVVASPLSKADEARLADHLNKQFRHNFGYRFMYCDEISRAASGKYEVFRSELSSTASRSTDDQG